MTSKRASAPSLNPLLDLQKSMGLGDPSAEAATATRTASGPSGPIRTRVESRRSAAEWHDNHVLDQRYLAKRQGGGDPETRAMLKKFFLAAVGVVVVGFLLCWRRSVSFDVELFLLTSPALVFAELSQPEHYLGLQPLLVAVENVRRQEQAGQPTVFKYAGGQGVVLTLLRTSSLCSLLPTPSLSGTRPWNGFASGTVGPWTTASMSRPR